MSRLSGWAALHTVAYHPMIGLQSRQGRMIGTTVVDESEPVVVSHSFPVIELDQ